MPGTGWVRVFARAADGESGWNVGTGHGRGAMAIDRSALWVANRASRTVTKLDLPHLEIAAIGRVRRIPIAVASGAVGVWVACSNGWLWRMHPETGRAQGVARLGRRTRALAVTESWVWALRENGELLRIEPATGEVTLRRRLGRGGRQMALASDALWVTVKRGHEVLRLDPDSGDVETRVKPLHQVISLAADGDSLWMGSRRWRSTRKGWLSRIDASEPALKEWHRLPGQPRALACGSGVVWLACAARWEREGTLQRFDPATGTLLVQEETQWPVYDLLCAGDQVLATMGIAISGPVDAGPGYFDLGAAGEGGGGGGEGG
jgi:streptogramin lyase